MLDEIIAIHAITDDLLKALGHHEDSLIYGDAGYTDYEAEDDFYYSSESLALPGEEL